MKHRVHIIIGSLLLTIFSCSKRQSVNVSEAPENAPLRISAEWVKHKGDMVDIKMTFVNRTSQYIEIEPQHFQCIRDNEAGTVEHKLDSSGLVRLYPSQSRTALVFCRFNSKVKTKAPITIKVEKVYGSNELAGESKRKVIANDIIWSLDPIN